LIAASTSDLKTPGLNLTRIGTVSSVDALPEVAVGIALSVGVTGLCGAAKAMDGAADMKLKRSSRRRRVDQRGASREAPWSPIRSATVGAPG